MSPPRARLAALIIVALDAIGWAVVAINTFWSTSDPATKGFDEAAGYVVTILFVLTGAPALVLAGFRRAPRLALGLALAFPAAFALAFLAAVIVFARL